MSVDSRPRERAALADSKAREFLRKADPVLARLIDERPDFRPRAWMDKLSSIARMMNASTANGAPPDVQQR